MIRLTIRRRVPSGNKSAFGSRFAYVKERNIWYALVRAALTPKEKPRHRVRVHIESHRVQLCDKTNMQFGCKSAVDALVRLGYLRDDNIQWLDDTYEQVKCKRVDERTIITIHNP